VTSQSAAVPAAPHHWLARAATAQVAKSMLDTRATSHSSPITVSHGRGVGGEVRNPSSVQ
jgi:hypothetical protein